MNDEPHDCTDESADKSADKSALHDPIHMLMLDRLKRSVERTRSPPGLGSGMMPAWSEAARGAGRVPRTRFAGSAMHKTLVFILVVIAVACGGSKHSGSELTNSSWSLGTVQGTGTLMIPANTTGSTPTLSFGASGSIAGSTGCNSFGGSYLVSASRLTITPQHTTTRKCATVDLMRQDVALNRSLPQVRQYQISGNVLQLSGQNGTLLLTYNRR